MYSPKSAIMTAHFISFNPFSLTEPRQKSSSSAGNLPNPSGGANAQEYLSYLKAYTVKRKSAFHPEDGDRGQEEAEKIAE